MVPVGRRRPWISTILVDFSAARPKSCCKRTHAESYRSAKRRRSVIQPRMGLLLHGHVLDHQVFPSNAPNLKACLRDEHQ